MGPEAVAAWLLWRPWLDVAGLGLDFVGVMLLASEWLIAIGAERREAERAEREARFRPSPMMPKPAGPHHEVFEDMRLRRDAADRAARGASVRGMRAGRFRLAMALIALGFLLQLAASIPIG